MNGGLTGSAQCWLQQEEKEKFAAVVVVLRAAVPQKQLEGLLLYVSNQC